MHPDGDAPWLKVLDSAAPDDEAAPYAGEERLAVAGRSVVVLASRD
jgi:hypothetical protein